MNFGGEEEEEEETNCRNTTFRTKSRNPSGKIIVIFLLIPEWNRSAPMGVGVCRWMGPGVGGEVKYDVMMLHLFTN